MPAATKASIKTPLCIIALSGVFLAATNKITSAEISVDTKGAIKVTSGALAQGYKPSNLQDGCYTAYFMSPKNSNTAIVTSVINRACKTA